MAARGTLCRLGVSKTWARDLPQLARLLQRTLLSRNASSLPAVRALSRAYTSTLDARRSYATATTTSATKPTATVKRAVKAKAAEKAPPKKRTTKATAAKTTKKSKATTKSKSKLKPKAKKAPKKAAPKKRVPKTLTPAQEEKAKTTKEKAKLSALRKTALKEPVGPRPLTAYLAFTTEQTQGKTSGNGAGTGSGKLAESSQKWKTLTPAEIEHYNHLAQEKNTARQAEYRAWVHSHTPQEIQAANNARAQLRRLLKNTYKRRYPAHTSKIIDDRQVKRPRSAWVLFTAERHATGDLKNIRVPEASKLIAEEWKALSAGEKKKYEDMFAAEKERYTRESPLAS